MILIVNFLLITLILYNIFNNNIFEHFRGCSKNQSNAVYRQQSLTDRLYGKVNKLESKFNSLLMLSVKNNLGVLANKQKTEGGIQDFEDDLDDQNNKLKKIGGKSSKPIKGNFSGPRNFSRALKSSQSVS